MTEQRLCNDRGSSNLNKRDVSTKENAVRKLSLNLENAMAFKKDDNMVVCTYKDLVTSHIDPSIRK